VVVCSNLCLSFDMYGYRQTVFNCSISIHVRWDDKNGEARVDRGFIFISLVLNLNISS